MGEESQTAHRCCYWEGGTTQGMLEKSEVVLPLDLFQASQIHPNPKFGTKLNPPKSWVTPKNQAIRPAPGMCLPLESPTRWAFRGDRYKWILGAPYKLAL